MILNRGAGRLKPVPLASVSASGSYIVESVSGGEQQRLRLCEMGIAAGRPVSVLACSSAGMRVVRAGGSRMALSAGIAENIWVQPKNS